MYKPKTKLNVDCLYNIPVLAGMDLEPYRKADVEYWKLSKIA